MAAFREAGAGLAGLFSWVVAALADRDLFFRDSHVLLWEARRNQSALTAYQAQPQVEPAHAGPLGPEQGVGR